MAHLEEIATASSTSPSSSLPESVSDMDLRSDMELYEIPPSSGSLKISKGKTGEKEQAMDALRHSQLHLEVQEFSKMLEMDPSELRRKKELVQIVTDVSWRLFRNEYRHLKVRPFGGFTNGLATKRSDIDIVLTGMFSPDGAQGGYSDEMKRKVNRCLDELLKKLGLPLKKKQLIRNARIPILKLTTEDGIDLDVSIGDHGGPEAAAFVKSQLDEYPVVRSLVLVVKFMLKARQLNDVSTSGLGTYSIANMAIAYVKDLKNKGENINEYGNVLLGFLHYYGLRFDIRRQAISLRRGSFCNKADVVTAGESPLRFRICIQDYFTGNDVSGGTVKVEEILSLFREAHRSLSKHEGAVPRVAQKSMFPLLSKFIDARTFRSAPPPTTITLSETEDEMTCKEWKPKRKRHSRSPDHSDTRNKATSRRTEKDRSSRRPRPRRTDGLLPPPIPLPPPPPSMAYPQRPRQTSISDLLSTVFVRYD